MKWFTILIIQLFFLQHTPAQNADKKCEKERLSISVKLENERFESAITAIDDYLKNCPATEFDYTLHKLKAMSYHVTEQYDKAVDHYLFIQNNYKSTSAHQYVQSLIDLAKVEQLNKIKKDSLKALPKLDLKTEKDSVLEKKPIQIIEKRPQFVICETAEDMDLCFQQTLVKHITKNLKTQIMNELELSGTVRTFVSFTVDENGDIVNISSRNGNALLLLESRRAIATLPKLRAGEHLEKPVKVLFQLPITYKIE